VCFQVSCQSKNCINSNRGLFSSLYSKNQGTPSIGFILVSIDELMVRCFGGSNHTYKMPNKPIKQGYKLYGIADHGYIYSWIWSSWVFGLEDIPVFDTLTNTGGLVRALVATLPRNSMTVYMVNYFTSVPLFESLRRLEYGALVLQGLTISFLKSSQSWRKRIRSQDGIHCLQKSSIIHFVLPGRIIILS
jgi:hypothetical protein